MLSLTFATLIVAVSALNGIVVPATVKAGTQFEATFENANDDKYRVYVAAALLGSNGPTCYLVNSTSLDASINLTIPADIGPSAGYYSIAIADITTGQASTFSNRFNLTNATGEYSNYENHLGGSPFWDADALPCTAYTCARKCADGSYPEDLTEAKAYDTMSECILNCDGVTVAANQTSPVHASTTSSSSKTTTTTTTTTTDTDSAAAATSSGAASRHAILGAAMAGVAGVAMFAL